MKKVIVASENPAKIKSVQAAFEQVFRVESFEFIGELIDQGMELGLADDKIFNRMGSKTKNGSVGLLTQNIIDRSEYCRHPVVLALIPFLNPELNFNGKA